MRFLLLLAIVLFGGAYTLSAQQPARKTPKSKLPYTERKVWLNTQAHGFVRGTVAFPKAKDTVVVCIIIPGSGPTDRNGNNGNILSTNMYKMMSDSLASNGFAVFRYDKYGVGDSKPVDFNEKFLRFDDYVKDVIEWAKFFKSNRVSSKRVKDVVLIGHSEGSLIGMLAADSSHAAGFISLAGAAQSADRIILDQLKTQHLTIREEAQRITERLKAGGRADTVSALLQSVYRPSVQEYLKSWFKYTPSTEIQKLKIPVLIVQGTTDVQVPTTEAQALKNAKPEADLVIIEGMSHVLKQGPADKNKNIATYFDTSLPLHPQLLSELLVFLQRIEKNAQTIK